MVSSSSSLLEYTTFLMLTRRRTLIFGLLYELESLQSLCNFSRGDSTGLRSLFLVAPFSLDDVLLDDVLLAALGRRAAATGFPRRPYLFLKLLELPTRNAGDLKTPRISHSVFIHEEEEEESATTMGDMGFLLIIFAGPRVAASASDVPVNV